MQKHKFELFADYFQFYLQDEAADGDLSESWTPEAVQRLLATAPGAVGVGTVRNMDVPVTVEVLDGEPGRDVELWDHVMECSIQVPSGRMVIAGSMDHFPSAARIEVSPGTYRMRVSYGALTSLSDDGLEGQDHYRVQMWTGQWDELRVLKKRKE